MRTYKVTLNHITPLLMKSTRGVNPLDPLVKEQKSLTSKKKKTDEDIMRLMEIDFELGAYYDDEVGFYIPAEMVEACIREGAKANRLGEKSKIAIFVNEERIPLLHHGPTELMEAYKSVDYKDIRIVTVNRAKVTRCRPRFNRWGLEFTVDLDNNIMNEDEFLNALDIAGKQKGLGDYRPRYGRFAVKVEQLA